jgi:general secretion pathway protein K
MLLAALVVSIAAATLFEQQRFINRLENHFSATQARWMGEASIHWSRAILAEDAKGGPVDHLKENWAIRLPDTPFEGGTIRGFITDQQQYFNLNNLMHAGGAGQEDIDFFRRLLSSLGSNPDAVESLKDWIDSDSDITYPYGAESEHYLAQPIPYRAGNQPLTEVGNLSRIQGFTEENIARLKQYCGVLPEPTPVNINTASPELLGIMLPELSQFDLQTIIAARNLRPFENLSEVSKLLEQNKIKLSEGQFSVGSHYFMVTSQTQFGKSTIRVEALLKRDGSGWPQLLWKRYR